MTKSEKLNMAIVIINVQEGLGDPYLTSVSSHPSKDNHAIWHVEHPISNKNHVHDRMVVGLTATYAIELYHHY
jgi:hypothetical protein